MNNCNTPNHYFYTSYIIGVIINIFIINTLNNIEKDVDCKCAHNDKKKYLKEWFTFIIFFNTFFLLFFFISSYECYDIYHKENMNIFFMFLMVIIQIIMLIRLFIYVKWLRNECKCSYGTEEKIIYWYLLILFILFLTSFLLIIFFLLIIGSKLQ
jgi:hypothetical protein